MKLLIADDEMQIRTGLEIGIDWKELGFHEVYTAENGVEALDLCRKYQPELVITDIRMPGMDGLELGKRISMMYSPVEIIILSGYSEFEYAREAIKLGAYDYLLKPINIRELIERVKKACEKVEKSVNDSAKKKELLILERIRTLQQLIMSRGIFSEEEEKSFASELKNKYGNEILVGVCSVDVLHEKNLDQFGIYLEKCMVEILEKYKAETLYWERGNLFFIMDIFSAAEFQRKKEALRKEQADLNSILKNQFENTVTIALSSQGKLKEAAVLFRECEEVLCKRMYSGKEAFLLPDERKNADKIMLSPINTEKLKSRIESLDYEHIHLYLKEIFASMRESRITSEDYVKAICSLLKDELLKTLSEQGIDIDGIFEHNRVLINEIPDYSTLSEFENWIDTLYQMILTGLSDLSGKRHSRVILQAVDYISQNYTGDINLEMTAEYVNKSKNYFSYLFKKELGISFIEYLNRVRVEAAKKLLDTTDDKTYEISEKIGYSDYKYFSSVFKKQTGMSPIQYKKREKS